MQSLQLVPLPLSAARFAQTAKPIRLSNGEDRSGWTHYRRDSKNKTEDAVTPVSAVRTIEGDILIFKSGPAGYVRTVQEYENDMLDVEWRLPEDTPGGQSNQMQIIAKGSGTTVVRKAPWQFSLRAPSSTSAASCPPRLMNRRLACSRQTEKPPEQVGSEPRANCAIGVSAQSCYIYSCRCIINRTEKLGIRNGH